MKLSIATPIIFILIILLACQSKPDKYIVNVQAKDFSFFVDDSIQSGWTTFRFDNQGHAEHFFLLSLLPDSISFDRYKNEVSHPFDIVLDSINAGESIEDAGALLGKLLPGWFFSDVKQMGGVGIVSPMEKAETTLKLSPGNYVMECYIKEKGKFHTTLGMIRPITVLKDSSSMPPPMANFEIEVANTEYKTSGEIKNGKNIFAVHFTEHPQYELGNDVQLIRIDENTDMQTVIEWLNWMNVEGLQSPAPVTFLGGTQEMPVGFTSYFTSELSPGSYAFIAESGAHRGLIHKFEIK